MNVKLPVIIILISALWGTVLGQQLSISGAVLDSATQKSLNSTTVRLFNTRNPGSPLIKITGKDGKFTFTNLPQGTYILEASFVGFKNSFDTIKLGRRSIEGNQLFLARIPIEMEEIQITGNAIPAQQNADTVAYSAKAFKVATDATAEDLVTKMPGIQKDGSTIKAQGEEVKQVYVDGKQFFGDDPAAALRNLPADIVDKVQVYDRMSDQAAFTGFDDGNSTKAINVVTRMGQRKTQFGKAYAGGGTEDRYSTGLAFHFISGDQRISVLGLGNNVNKQNFSFQDILGISGSGGRGGMGGRMMGGGGNRMPGVSNFTVSSQDGNTTTWSGGVSLIDTWYKNLQITGSYFFNYAKNNTGQQLYRDYITGLSANQTYYEDSKNNSTNYNNRVNVRLEYTIDTLNSLIFTPRISFQNNNSGSSVFSKTYIQNIENLNSSTSQTDRTVDGYSFGGELLWRHKFDTPGRTVSINLSSSANNKHSYTYLTSLNQYFSTHATVQPNVNQKTYQETTGLSGGVNINYTEPLHKNGMLQLTASGTVSNDQSTKDVDSLDNITGQYNWFNPTLSNTYENTYTTLRGGAAYRVRDDNLNASVELNYQNSGLDGKQTYPVKQDVDKNFESFLPALRVQFRFSKSSNLRFNYQTSINPPSISQLQNTIDNSNPVQLSMGNPDLSEEYSHRVNAMYMTTDQASGSMFFGNISYTYTKHPVSTATYTALKDTNYHGLVFLPRGSQLSFPTNLDQSHSFRGFVNYGTLLHSLMLNLNTFFSFSYTRQPGLINDIETQSDVYSYSPGVSLNSNISEDLDYRLVYSPAYSISRSTSSKLNNNKYTIQNLSGSFSWVYYAGLFIKADASYVYNTGITGSVDDKRFMIVNLGLGSKLFSDKSGEIKLEVFDAFNQNKGLSRNVNELYSESKTVQVLQRYYLLTFTYNLKATGLFNNSGQGPRDRDRDHWDH
ncbi:MAG: TonB-dependent receptor [Ignavibacteria bacterium]|nr:TonB-dependent receptor [Ignavibacteria bacterium]